MSRFHRYITTALGATAFLLVPVLTSAAEEPVAPAPSAGAVRVATVNIQDASIVSQDGRTLRISFKLSNREGAQTGVSYGVKLIAQTEGGQFIADSQTLASGITLAENTTLPVDITYTAPPSLTGTYTVLLTSENDSGLPLGLTPAGTVTFSADTATGIELVASSCYLIIPSEEGNPHYTLVQGVDIAATESLALTCTAINHEKGALTATPTFTTHYRTTAGEEVTQTGGTFSSVTLPPGAAQQVTLTLPKATEPQAYDIVVNLTAGRVASNSLVVHYVLRGASATVTTLSLDKTAYSKGDTALLAFFWAQSADNFPGARASAASPSAVSYTATLTDGGGAACAEPVSEQLGSDMNLTASFAVSRTCTNPQATVTLLDAEGTTLAERSFTLKSTRALNLPLWALIIGLVGAALAIYAYARRRAPRTSTYG